MKLIFHSFRCFRSALRGVWDRQYAVGAYAADMAGSGRAPQTAGDGVGYKRGVGTAPSDAQRIMLPIDCETKMKMFMGLRLCDNYFHVNHMRYLELFELARWHHMGVTDCGRRSSEGCVFPVVSSANVQYFREIKPWQNVVVRTKMAGVSGKGLVHLQQIESVDGKTIFCTAIVRLSWLQKASKSLMSRHIPGTLEVQDALVKLGCSEDDIASIVEGRCIKDMDGAGDGRYWGKVVSSYDSPGAVWDGRDSARSCVSLARTYVASCLQTVNERDVAWRDTINQRTRERKPLIRGERK